MTTIVDDGGPYISQKLAETAVDATDHAFDRVKNNDHDGAHQVLSFVERLTKMLHSIEDHDSWLELNLRNADRPADVDTNVAVAATRSFGPKDIHS